MAAASTVVIKVKYGDVVRRFNARIVDEELDFSMDGLKEKVLSLFSLAPGTELMLTYIDEDGDVVTLVHADDLRDVVKQGLDPVRITAKLISTTKGSFSDSCSTELVDYLLKMGLFYLVQLNESQTTANPSTNSDVPKNSQSQTKTESSDDMSKVTADPSTDSDVSENNLVQTKTKDPDTSKLNGTIFKAQENDREEPFFNSNERSAKLQHAALETPKAASLAVDCGNSNLEEKSGESSCFPTEKEVNEPNDGPTTGNIITDDRAVIPRTHNPCKAEGYWDPHHNLPTLSFKFKLNCCMIKSVSKISGTVVAPLTQFTQIWQMRNSGSVVWPQGTRLVSTSSHNTGSRYSVELEIPAGGLPVGQDLDIAVDLIAPDIPGKYVTYWRMVSPSGEMFGHRIGLLIQVDASVKETPPEIVEGSDLNLPPVSNTLTGPGLISDNADVSKQTGSPPPPPPPPPPRKTGPPLPPPPPFTSTSQGSRYELLGKEAPSRPPPPPPPPSISSSQRSRRV